MGPTFAMRALRNPLECSLAVLFSARAALRVWWHEPRSDLGILVRRLRSVRPTAGSRDPLLLAGVAGRLLPFLPPWRMGRCWKRSLMLVDLWSRCGLEPRIHFGVAPETSPSGSPDPRGHAWVTAAAPAPAPDTGGCAELWSC